jgi:TonB family protein
MTIVRFLTVSVSCAVLLGSVPAQSPKNVEVGNTTASVPLQAGTGVTAPRPIYVRSPEFSETARKAGFQGTCVLSLIVGTDGKPRDIRVERKLGMLLDEKAVEAVRNWTFEPGQKDGKPVAVRVNVEVSFRLYQDGEAKMLSGEPSEQMFEARSRMQSHIYRVSESREPIFCASSSDHDARLGPVVTIAELTFEGDLGMPSANRDQLTASLMQRTYSGKLDGVATEISERVKAAWQSSGYSKAQVYTDARVLTSSPDNERVAVAVHVDEGPQYRLEQIRFRNNQAIGNVEVLRKLFPIRDGDVFDRAAIGKGLENLRFAYGQLGYINLTSVPDTQFSEERQTISLDIDLDEGKQFVVSRIDIIGSDQSGFQNVLKEIVVKPGDIYNQRLVDLSLQHSGSLLAPDAVPEPRFNLQLNKRAGTVAITYDFRRCQVD